MNHHIADTISVIAHTGSVGQMMKKGMRNLIGAITLLVAMQSSLAQPNPRDKAQQDIRESYFAEVHLLPNENATSSTVLCMVRFTNDLLTFYKSPTVPLNERTYYAPYTITIECRDTMGIIRHSKFISDTIFASSFEATISRTRSTNCLYTLTLPQLAYTVNVEIGQNTTTLRRYKSELMKLQPSNKGVMITKPIIAADGSSSTFQPLMNNGNVPFGIDAVRLFSASINVAEGSIYQYRLIRKLSGAEETPRGTNELSGRATLRQNSVLQLPSEGVLTKDSTLSIVSVGTNDARVLFESRIPLGELFPGKYSYQLFRSGGRDTLKYDFDLNWNEMPFSLRNPKYAAESMYTLLSEGAYDDLLDNNEKDLAPKIYDWWKSKDPTPRTVYNEAMVEYFRRVDYARTAYQTFSDADGSRTDRGKIYMLYGSPTYISRHTDPGEITREVWIYENKVRKKFTFESGAKGVFRLARIEEM